MPEHHCHNSNNTRKTVKNTKQSSVSASKIHCDATQSKKEIHLVQSKAMKHKNETLNDKWQRYQNDHIDATSSMIEWHSDDGIIDGTDTDIAYKRSNAMQTKTSDSDTYNDDDLLTISEGGEYLGITGAALKRIILKENIAPDATRPGKYGNIVSLYSIDTLEQIADTSQFEKEVRRISSNKANEPQIITDDIIANEKAKLARNIHVSIRQRTNVPSQAMLYIGPTNSGKSYHAIEKLVADYEHDPDGLYVYAGPLRMLAYEVYEKLCDRIGSDEVGFVTGEDQINQDAHIRCCTVEMAPMTGTSLVLDEAHWMCDPDRGQYWTNLLIGGEYDHFYVIAAQEAEQAVSGLLSDAINHQTIHCDRLTPLEYAGTLSIEKLPPRTAVIAFSRRGVYSLANRINAKTNLKCGVLYGALPLNVRRQQIERYIKGDYDIMVTTDVIGHGINLPIDNIVFAQTDKFDGIAHRELYLWEAAQIAGRAGRYGMTDIGKVYGLDSESDSNTHCDTMLIQQAALAACGEIPTDLSIDKALVTPHFNDLGVTKPEDIMLALDTWSDMATDRLSSYGIAAAPMRERRKLMAAMAVFAGAPLWPWSNACYDWAFSPELAWSLSGAPLDPEGDALYHIVCWASDENPDTSSWLQDYFDTITMNIEQLSNSMTAEEKAGILERAYASLEQLKMIHVVCGTLGSLDIADVEDMIDTISDRIDEIMTQASEPEGYSHRHRHRSRNRSKKRKAA